jgi:hypothetical protein
LLLCAYYTLSKCVHHSYLLRSVLVIIVLFIIIVILLLINLHLVHIYIYIAVFINEQTGTPSVITHPLYLGLHTGLVVVLGG